MKIYLYFYINNLELWKNDSKVKLEYNIVRLSDELNIKDILVDKEKNKETLYLVKWKK